MTKPITVLKSYRGHVIENIGCVDLQADFGGQLVEIPFNVVKGNVKPILGKVTREGLGLLNKSYHGGSKYARGLVVLNYINMDRIVHLWWRILQVKGRQKTQKIARNWNFIKYTPIQI